MVSSSVASVFHDHCSICPLRALAHCGVRGAAEGVHARELSVPRDAFDKAQVVRIFPASCAHTPRSQCPGCCFVEMED